MRRGNILVPGNVVASPYVLMRSLIDPLSFHPVLIWGNASRKDYGRYMLMETCTVYSCYSHLMNAIYIGRPRRAGRQAASGY